MRFDDDSYHSDDHVDYSMSPISFPQKLFILLDDQKSELIQWSINGLCFRITDPDRFAKETVPKYFKQSKLTSFQRQLNLYGFRRIPRGEDVGCYFHPKFHQGRKDLLKEIKRLPPKGSLMSYEEVLQLHARGGSNQKRKSMQQTEALPRNDFYSSNSFYSLSGPQQATSFGAMQSTLSCDSSHDACNSSISSWSSDCDSADCANSLECDDFGDLFSLSQIDFDTFYDIPLDNAVEQREYIPTYEEAVIYGLISQ